MKLQEKENNSMFSLMKMQKALAIKQKPKPKHHTVVNYQTQTHYSKHIKSNFPRQSTLEKGNQKAIPSKHEDQMKKILMLSVFKNSKE